MQCTTANTYKSDSTDVYGDYREERQALGFSYFSNFTRDRQALQDKLIRLYIGDKKRERVENPTCTFMMGTPGSGKTTEADHISKGGAFVIDADLFKEALPEFREFPRRLASGVVHREAAYLAAILQRRIESLGVDFIVDNASANRTWLEGEITRLRAQGYRLELVRTVLEKSKCYGRCQSRGRHVPRFVIDQIYEQVNATFLHVHDKFDRVRVIHT
jgi:predicted ABC-type ATPase